jgi:hypothetical protein
MDLNRKQLRKIKEREHNKLRSFIGKCYKQEVAVDTAGAWWTYRKVVGVQKNMLKVVDVQIFTTKKGNIRFGLMVNFDYDFDLDSRWARIGKKEFRIAKLEANSKIDKLLGKL